MRLPREKLLAIPNGIDMERWVHTRPISRGRLGLSPNRSMILFAGRLDPQKRPDWLLKRMPAVFDRLPDHDLVLAGEGPLRSSLGRLAEQLGISDRIHFVGWQPDMPSLLAAADLRRAYFSMGRDAEYRARSDGRRTTRRDNGCAWCSRIAGRRNCATDKLLQTMHKHLKAPLPEYAMIARWRPISAN